MRILVLAGKSVKKDQVHGLLAGSEYELAHYVMVSRGVRRLEKAHADLVLIIPDPADESWHRAIVRIRQEFRLSSILILSAKDGAHARAFEAGAYDVFEPASVTPECLSRCLRHLTVQMGLENHVERDLAMHDWVEETGRLGTWEMDATGRTIWSRGVRRIVEDAGGQLTEDFKSIREFVHPDDLEIFDQANKATFEQGWPLDFEYRIQVGDGNIRYLHLHRRVELGPNGDIARAFGMVRDVSSEREFENYLFRRDAVLQVVGSFAARFLRESDWESGIADSLVSLGKAVDVTRAYIFRKKNRPDAEPVMDMVHEWVSSGVSPLFGLPQVHDQPLSPLYDRLSVPLKRRRVVAGIVRNLQTDERRFLQASGAKSILLIPVFAGEEWWGFIGFSEHRNERDWLPVEIESLTLVADILGSAILRRRMGDQLMEANRVAEEASHAKSRFLANMSHEIRTPISGILGMADMTMTTSLTSQQRENLSMIRDAAGSLLAIVNDVLDISKIEARKMELKPHAFTFRAEIETMLRPFKAQAFAKGVGFHSTVAKDIPSTVYGDRDRLNQVVGNLLSNALKFTERGLIEVTVAVVDRQPGRTCLRFSVSDTGEGIPKDKLGTVFDSFVQADNSTGKRHQGTGLGLAISRELVQMMGGRLGAKSEPGKGSVFSFTVWFRDPKEVAVAIPKSPAEQAGVGLGILLVEDNLLNQRFMTHFLSRSGHSVTVAGNGLEALEELRRRGREFDLILMDIQMPEMGGMETTTAIRRSDSDQFDPRIPIIALTAYAMKGDRERMIEVGMDEYVSKPVDMAELEQAMARCVADKRAASESALPISEPQGSLVAFDMDGLIERFQGNMGLLKEILGLFLTEAEDKIAKLDHGVKCGDIDELGEALHSITNISSHVLAMEIVREARNLEKLCFLGKLPEAQKGVAVLRAEFVALVKAVRQRSEAL